MALLTVLSLAVAWAGFFREEDPLLYMHVPVFPPGLFTHFGGSSLGGGCSASKMPYQELVDLNEVESGEIWTVNKDIGFHQRLVPRGLGQKTRTSRRTTWWSCYWSTR